MGGVIAQNMFNILIGVCFVYGANNNNGVIAIDSKSESDLHESFEHPQIWSTLLEQVTINEWVSVFIKWLIIIIIRREIWLNL